MSTYASPQYITLGAASAIGTAFLLVKVDTNGSAALCSAVTDQPIGVIQGTVPAGGRCQIQISGISKVSGGAALTIGQQIASDSAGQGTAITVAAAGTVYNYAVGRVVKASAAANGLAEVFLYTGGRNFLV